MGCGSDLRFSMGAYASLITINWKYLDDVSIIVEGPLLGVLDFLTIWLDYLGSLSERITSTTQCIRCKRCTRHRFSSRKPQRRKPRKLLQNNKMIKSSNKKCSATIFLSSYVCLSLSCALESVCGVCKWGRVPPYLYPFRSLTKYNIWAYMSSHIRPTSPRETTSTYYMMLHWGLCPWLTIEVAP